MDTALSVAALVVSLFSAGFTLYTFIWTKVRDRKQATLEAYNRLQEQVLDKRLCCANRAFLRRCKPEDL